jgi:hypothetical protein
VVYHGKVRNGVVEFDTGTALPEGTEVRIEPVSTSEQPVAEGPMLAEQFENVIGTVPELPPDMAAQHDHYLHGAPKQ